MVKEIIFGATLGLLLLCSRSLEAKPPYVVMPYIAEWATVTAAQVPWGDITYIAEAFALPQANGATPTFANGQIANLVSTAHSNSTRCVISIGGASASLGNWNTSTDPTYVATFIANIMGIVGTYGYDGVDIDWEFPNHADWTPSETAQFSALMSGLYDALHNSANPNYKGLAYDGGPKNLSFYITPGYDSCGVAWSTIGNYCDFAVLPGYDMCPDGVTEGPINGSITATDCANNTYVLTVASNAGRFSAAGFPKTKMVLGMPFYTCGGGTISAITASGSHTSFNATSMESVWNGTTVNDSQAFCAKMNWALGQGFKGISMWELDQAYPTNATSEVQAIWNTIAGNTCVNVGTPTPSPTTSPSRTPSATRTATRTVTATDTPVNSATPTPTATLTPSASATPSVSPSPSPSATATATATATPSVSPSPSATRTATGTRTPSATPTLSATASGTPTTTPSYTASPVASPTASPTLSPSFSASPSATASPSMTPSAMASATETASPTATASLTVSPAFSATDSPTSTGTATLGPSATPSVTASATPTPSATASPSMSPSASPTRTPPHNPTATPSVSGTPTFSPTAGATGGGVPGLQAGWASPDPVRGPWVGLRLKHLGPADKVLLRLYTAALVLALNTDGAGAAGPGVVASRLALPVGLPRGVYYLQARAQKGSQVSAPVLVRFYYLGP